MNRNLFSIAIILTATACGHAQGTFIFDQQDSTNETGSPYGTGSTIQSVLPHTGQSFIPTLPGIDFIRLKFTDANPGDNLGATIFLNLRSTSITGPILGTTADVTMPNGFSGTTNFLFPTTIPLMPGTTYYFDLNLVSGGPWDIDIYSYYYPNGESFVGGQPHPGGNYWFREGIIAAVPEPSSVALLLLAGGLLVIRATTTHA